MLAWVKGASLRARAERVRMLRSVKDDLTTPLRDDVERVAEEEGPRWGEDASWRVQGGRVRRSRS